MKAWSGRNFEGNQAVVWAETRGLARQAVANELEISFMEVEDFGRMPELDDFTGDLLKWQLEAGWTWECICGKRAGEDYGYAIYEPNPPTEVHLRSGLTITRDRHVMCSEACVAKHRDWQAERDRVERECLVEFEKMHPGVKARDTICNEYNWLVDAGEPLNRYVTVRDFRAEKNDAQTT